jgi:hypothetical protein
MGKIRILRYQNYTTEERIQQTEFVKQHDTNEEKGKPMIVPARAIYMLIGDIQQSGLWTGAVTEGKVFNQKGGDVGHSIPSNPGW